MDSVVAEMKKRGFSTEEALEIASKIGIKCIADFAEMSITCLTRYPRFKTQLVELRNAHTPGHLSLWYVDGK